VRKDRTANDFGHVAGWHPGTHARINRPGARLPEDQSGIVPLGFIASAYWGAQKFFLPNTICAPLFRLFSQLTK